MNLKSINKNLLTAVLIIIVALTAIIFTADKAFAVVTATVNSSIGLNMRTGPGTGYDVVITIPDNAEVTVIEKGGEWSKISYGGKTGYVSSGYLIFKEEDKPRTGTVNSSAGLNVRTGPGTEYPSIYVLENKSVVEIKEQTGQWYKISYNGITGYVSAGYIVIDEDIDYVYDEAFEAALNEQGFPESYKPYLRNLHAANKGWVFKAQHTGLNWSDVIAKESKIGINLVHKSADDSWKSKEPGAFDSSGRYIEFDSGGWIAASKGIIEYYMDPRNFLTKTAVFQFMAHSYDSQTQSKEGLQKLVAGTFLANKFPEPGYDTYSDALIYAGSQSGANPYVLASMILVEQGRDGGGKSISGKVSGFEGYYNYFNIRAYASGIYDAVEYGLLYARQQGWDTHIESILGGASYYAKNYIKNNQNTLYLKKFNVMNGIDKVASHQYMTNIGGAASEANNLQAGYSASSMITFYIPVYENMPASACKLPNETGYDDFFENKTTVRIYGDDRYDTSIKVAEAYKKNEKLSGFDNIIVASGNDYADALSGTYLAAAKDAPILLVGEYASSMNKIKNYIASNLKTGGTVYILGGTGAVSKEFESMLSGYNVKRIGGNNRYETNINILKEAGVTGKEIMICSGEEFADGLSVSATGKPVILAGKNLSSDQIEYIKQAGFDTYYIIGGEGAVSKDVENTAGKMGKTQRIFGQNRYATSAAIAEKFFPESKKTVFVFGETFADGLSGGSIALSFEGPVLLLNSSNTKQAADYVRKAGVDRAAVLGGPALISDNMINSII